MFAYLSKKIGIPNNSTIASISWNGELGQIAIGGDKGLLKILKLEEQKGKDSQGQQNPPPPSVNITLENHSGIVTTVVWNEKYRKLTSSDSNGLIIVWMLHKNYWFEEMINNRNKSTVKDMKWSPDGSKICIMYEDGALILGSVDGQRLWGKEYKFKLEMVEFSPDSKLMLFGTPEGEVKVHDVNGNMIHQIKMHCLQRIVNNNQLFKPDLPLASIVWYENAKMYSEDTPNGLCIAYKCGRVQLMRNDKDDIPTLIDTSMKIACARWNPNGTILALSGNMVDGTELRPVVQFYNNQGNHLKTLRLAGCDTVGAVSWEGNGLRLALAASNSLFIANIRHNYKWGYLDPNIIVFGYQKQDRVEYSVIFYQLDTQQKNIKFVKNLCEIRTFNDLCCVINKIEFDGSEFWQIDLCNSIGSPIDSKIINIEPTCVTMTKTHIIVCSADHIYVWQYRNQVSRLTAFEVQTGLRKIGRETAWFIDQAPDQNQIYDKDKFDLEQQTEDIICAIAANENFLFVGRMSGQINKYTLPHITLENKLFLKQKPNQMTLNSNGTRIAVIDLNGVLNILQINQQGGSLLEFEKKDCWYVRYSDDNPDQFVFFEKSRLYTVNDTVIDEPIMTDSYVCQFKDMIVKCVYLDDLMRSPDWSIQKTDLILEIETKTLKAFKDLLYKQSPDDVYNFIKKNYPYNCLWTIYAKKSLEDLDFLAAEKAFVELSDYQALQFLKRIQQLDDKDKQRAEILAYYGKMDEAEEIYEKMERKDLAISMRIRHGDWFRVLQLVKEGTGNDQTLLQSYNELGSQFADRQQWDKAAQFYELGKNYEGMVEAYSRLEDYASLEKLIMEIPERTQLLMVLGEKFQMVGLCENAVKCFEKFGDIKRAIDCSVLLNHWNIAIDLAEKYNFPQIEGLLSSYAQQLIDKKQTLEAAELYRKANRNTEAAKLLSQIADNLIERDANPLNIKKLYVMAALEVDLYKRRMLDATITGQGQSTANTLNTLITSTINTSSSTEKILNNPWRGAEAWHYFLLCQRQLYNGQFSSALKTAIRLQEYELDIEPRKIYSLLALAGFYNKSYRELSRAFVKLEGIKGMQIDEKERYQEIAASIFTKHPPKDPQCQMYPCPGKNCKSQITEFDTHCKFCGSNFSGCVASGRSIIEKNYYSCKACRHKMIEAEVKKMKLNNCALCHTPVDPKRFGISEND